MTDRRQVLMGLMLALGGPSALAACDPGAGDDAILRALQPNGRLRFYSRKNFRLLGLLSDAIIPRTDTPGAIDAGVPAFLDAMMDVWASDETKNAQRSALTGIGAELHEIGGRDLARLPDEERRAAIATLDAQAYVEDAPAPEPDSVLGQYRALKTLIAQVYYATEVGATQELHYEAVPGRWRADAPLAEIGRTWAE
jgi:gluconate 2-dehydrogenase gamma chain